MEFSSKYLPSKTFLKSLGTIGLIIVIVVSIREIYVYGKKYLKSRGEFTATPIIVKNLAVEDLDQNGIPDWQDNLSPILDNQPIASKTETAPVNETEQFARDLLTTAATISQSGSLTEEGAQTIAKEVTDRIAGATIGQTFTTADIIVIADSKKARDAYVQQVIKILNTQYPLDIDNSVSILQLALSTGDAGTLTQLNPISNRYEKVIQTFKQLPVPSTYADRHLEFLNVLGKVHGSIEMMHNSFTNPVMAMSVLMNYSNTISDLLSYISPFTSKLPYSTIALDGNGSANQ